MIINLTFTENNVAKFHAWFWAKQPQNKVRHKYIEFIYFCLFLWLSTFSSIFSMKIDYNGFKINEIILKVKIKKISNHSIFTICNNKNFREINYFCSNDCMIFYTFWVVSSSFERSGTSFGNNIFFLRKMCYYILIAIKK